MAITGTRADWGLLLPALNLLREDRRFELRICVTGQHLDPASPSLDAVRADGFEPDYFVDMKLGGDDSSEALAAAMGRCTAGVGGVIAESKPDMILVLGDRYEILAAASAALIARVPIAHLCGGDVTLGAFDDAIRHALSKMSSLHFVTNNQAGQRLLQMGEEPERIIVSGSPGIDRLLAEPVFPRDAFLAEVSLPPGPFILVSFHPETLAANLSVQLGELIKALEAVDGFNLLLTGSNADPGAREIDRAFSDLAERRAGTVFVQSLGSRRYIAALRHAEALMGNSSSGLYEAPSFATPCVNIGNRQEGRLRAASVFDCDAEANAILEALDNALAWRRRTGGAQVTNPFGDGQASRRIVERLAEVANPLALLRKNFMDIPA
ncbi:MAG: UDP-N-acetylglucosamine 2-epimerase [Wenzhouxiangella sp.]